MSDQVLSDRAAYAVAILREEFEAGHIHEMHQTVEGDGIRQPMSWALTIRVFQK